MIRLISAVSKNGVIGKDNSIPWDYPEDMKFFRKMTAGATVIMGRKTYNSIGRPLPKRRNVVVTSSNEKIDGVELAHSFENAVDMVSTPMAAVCQMTADGKQILPEDKDNIWLIGGSSIYRSGMMVADEIYLTLIPEIVNGDNLIYFPWIPPSFKIEGDLISIENSELKVVVYSRV